MNIKQLLKEELENFSSSMKLVTETYVSDNLKYHLENNIPLSKSIFRSGSNAYLDLVNEVRELHNVGFIDLNKKEHGIELCASCLTLDREK